MVVEERIFSFTTGMEFPNVMKLSLFFRESHELYLLTNRNYVSKA